MNSAPRETRAARRAREREERRDHQRADLVPPPLVIAPGLDVPTAIRPDLGAALAVLQHLDRRHLDGQEIFAFVRKGATQVSIMPRAEALDACRELPWIARELAAPMPGGRVRVTIMRPDGTAYFAGVRWTCLAAGGPA